METGFRGTFVIPWSQSKVDGQGSSPISDLRVGVVWSWTGAAVRVDGPSSVLPLGDALGDAELRRRVALTVRRLLASPEINAVPTEPPTLQTPLFSSTFDVTDGRALWQIVLIGTGAGRNPLLMFQGEIPPRATDLWVVRASISTDLRRQPQTAAGGVICFTPGTRILTPNGVRDVADLSEGDLVQTQDNGAAPILWLGQKRVSGARMRVIPGLAPIRLRAGALDKGVPDDGLLVSPDHRVVLRGARARALFNSDEVLVAARDLINDDSVIRDYGLPQVTYIHMMLPSHEIVFANGVATESFHPASAALASMEPAEQTRLLNCLPEIKGNPMAYGNYARRLLTDSDAAILRLEA